MIGGIHAFLDSSGIAENCGANGFVYVQRICFIALYLVCVICLPRELCHVLRHTQSFFF